MPGKVAVKPIVRKDVAQATAVAVPTSGVLAVVCGADAEAASRHEARSDAPPSSARHRALAEVRSPSFFLFAFAFRLGNHAFPIRLI
ncbi:MAG: hypothetical protein IJI54_03275 [Kiritimatiellae bacterium]|nr:hypothetical protein [Kiritimatiellia bacterium]